MKVDGANRNAFSVSVFTRGDTAFAVAAILDSAWLRGELDTPWQEFLLSEQCVERATDADLEPDAAVLQTLSDEVRYQLDLITAEETEAWLAARDLTLDDFTDYFHRLYWRRHFANENARTDPTYVDAPVELRQTFARQLWFSGKLTKLARTFAWRVADPTKAEIQALLPNASGSMRNAFLGRAGGDLKLLPPVLRQIDRDVAWFDALAAQEERFAAVSEQICTNENRVRRLALLRLPLTKFEVEVMDLESEDAAREVCMCLEADGLSMEEVAAQEHYRVERREVLLEEFAEELQPRLLGAEVGQVRQFSTGGERFQVCRIVNKREPTLADDRTVQRVDAELLSSHFENLVAKHIVWTMA